MRRPELILHDINGHDIEVPSEEQRRRPIFARAIGTRFDLEILATSEDSPGEAVIDLFDYIGYGGVTAKSFADTLHAAGQRPVTLRINSPGGDVFDGIAIYNLIASHPSRVRVEVVGLAASAASLIAMAGDELAIAESAMLMIHNAWAFSIGDRHEMARMRDVLAKIDGVIARTYASRTGRGVRAMAQLMDAETWLTSHEALEGKFVDEVFKSGDAKAVEAAFDISIFDNAPEERVAAMTARLAAARPTVRDIEAALRERGVSNSKAKFAAGMVAKAVNGTTEDGPDLREADELSPAQALELNVWFQRQLEQLRKP